MTAILFTAVVMHIETLRGKVVHTVVCVRDYRSHHWLSEIRFSVMKKDHRIFGYEKNDIYSTKMILLSIFTNEVENNPFYCKYRTFYDTNGMTHLKLKYVATEGDFLNIEIIKEGKTIDEVYMLKK